jgi:hypothetical protein
MPSLFWQSLPCPRGSPVCGYHSKGSSGAEHSLIHPLGHVEGVAKEYHSSVMYARYHINSIQFNSIQFTSAYRFSDERGGRKGWHRVSTSALLSLEQSYCRKLHIQKASHLHQQISWLHPEINFERQTRTQTFSGGMSRCTRTPFIRRWSSCSTEAGRLAKRVQLREAKRGCTGA